MSKTILVTGASRGIGRATALYFLNKGYNVIANYNNSKEEAKETFKNFENCLLIKADVTKKEEVKNMINSGIEKFHFIDCVVNNAGISDYGLFQDKEESDFDRVFSVNVKGVFNVIKEVLPFMIREQKGNIINIASMWGITGASNEVLYSSSKSAVIGMTKALAKEVGPSGIKVNCIAPGVIDTDMLKGLSEEELNILKEETPLMKIGSPDDIAKVVYFLAGEDSSFITGQTISVDGGMII